MSTFTKGKWWIAPTIFDGNVIYAPANTNSRSNEVVAMGILNKADARLIAAAPEMFELLQTACDFLIADYIAYHMFGGDNDMNDKRNCIKSIQQLFARINNFALEKKRTEDNP